MFPKLLKMVQVECLKLLKIRLWDFIIGLLEIRINMRLKSSGTLGPRFTEDRAMPDPFNPIELEQAFGELTEVIGLMEDPRWM